MDADKLKSLLFSEQVSLAFQWLITLLLILLTGLLIYCYFITHEPDFLIYIIIFIFCATLICPRSPLASRFPLWQRILILILLGWFL